MGACASRSPLSFLVITSRTRRLGISAVLICATLAQFVRGADPFSGALTSANEAGSALEVPPESGADPFTATSNLAGPGDPFQQEIFLDQFDSDGVVQAAGEQPKKDAAKFPNAFQIPDTEVWWKFGGYVKGDFIHDFEPAGTEDRFVPPTIPTDGSSGQNTLLQAKATRLNLDVRAPSDWGVVRGFVEGDFFTTGNNLRIRHAYAEVGHLLAGQTWTAFTDPAAIPRTLDFESPIAFITLRQAQFRWTQPLTEELSFAISMENPQTVVDDIVTTTIPGEPRQPAPDFVTRLKYKDDSVEWLVASLFRELTYEPDIGPTVNQFGFALNLVGILYPTPEDKIIGQILAGSGLGRYRSGSDLGLQTPFSVDTVTHLGACLGLTHDWNDKLSSTGVYSFALRRQTDANPADTSRFSSYLAVNLIWEPISDTTMGIEYLYGTNETHDGKSGSANRIQMSVQYNFP